MCGGKDEREGDPFFICDCCDARGAHKRCLLQLEEPVPESGDEWFCSDCEAGDASDSDSGEMAGLTRQDTQCVPAGARGSSAPTSCNPNPSCLPLHRIAAARRAFDDDVLAVAAPKRKSGVAPFPEEMPDFKGELKKSNGKSKTFMALLAKVSRPGTGNLVLRFVHADPEVADEESDTDDHPEATETQVGFYPPGIADPTPV